MIRIVTAPAAYPVTMAEAKEWARIDSTDSSQDGILTMLIAMATEYAEHKTGRAFVERTLELILDRFGNADHVCIGSYIELPWAPLIGIDSIKYTDLNRTEQTVSASDYEIDTTSQPGRVRPVWGSYWPVIGYGFNPVRIQYRAGYRPVGSPTDLTDNTYLPGALRTWMQARITTFYDNRGQVMVERATVDPLPRDYVDGLLDPLVIGSRIF